MRLYQLILFSKHHCNYCLIWSNSYLQSSHSGDKIMGFSHTVCWRTGIACRCRGAALAQMAWLMEMGGARRDEEKGMEVGHRCSVFYCWDWALKTGFLKTAHSCMHKTQCHHTTTIKHPHALLQPRKHVFPVGRRFQLFESKVHHSESAGICGFEQLLVSWTGKRTADVTSCSFL